MNSQKPETSCKNCIFAIYEDTTQVGCDHNRIQKFGNDIIEAYDIEKKFYVINRICNTFRTRKWNNGNKDILKARQESCISFDLLIDVNDINEAYYICIKNTLSSINYPSDKYRIIFYHAGSIPKFKKQFISKLYQLFPSSMISVYFDKFEYLNSLVVKSKNLFHILLNEQNILDINKTMHISDKYINDDLNRFIVAKYIDTIIISNLVCRFIYPNFYSYHADNLDNLILTATKQSLYIDFENEKK